MALRDYIFNKFRPDIPSLTTGQSWPQVIDTTGSLSINPEGRRATYRAQSGNAVAGGILSVPSFSMGGSASKLIRITRIYFSVTAATGGNGSFFVNRYPGGVFTGGTPNLVIARPLDINNPVSQATNLTTWATAATSFSGTPIMLASATYEVVTTAVSVLPQIIDWSFGDKSSQPIVLRGTSDFIGFGLSNPGTTPNCNSWIEWTEE